jgi:hypothetical protein
MPVMSDASHSPPVHMIKLTMEREIDPLFVGSSGRGAVRPDQAGGLATSISTSNRINAAPVLT